MWPINLLQYPMPVEHWQRARETGIELCRQGREVHQGRCGERQEAGAEHDETERRYPRYGADEWRNQQHSRAQAFDFLAGTHEMTPDAQRCVALLVLNRVPNLMRRDRDGRQ